MTARAVAARPRRAPTRAPAVASTTLRQIMAKPPRRAVVLGSSSHAVWVLADDEVVVVSTSDATRLPNGVELALRSSDKPFASIEHGTAVAIGTASVIFDGLSVDVVRWWDPRPAVPAISVDGLAAAIEGLPASVPDLDPVPLRDALDSAAPPAVMSAVRSLLGRGSGLTPEADDYLAGAIAATRILGAATESPRVGALLDQTQSKIEAEAIRRTTSFSAALIRCAVRGQVAAPAGAFLRAIAGRGDVGGTHHELSRVGHSSGPALAAGIVLGAQSLIHSHTMTIGGSP